MLVTPAPQKAAVKIGEAGCYFLSILNIAEAETCIPFDAFAAYHSFTRTGVVRDDCYVLDAGKLMSRLTQRKYDCIKAGPGHELPGDYILRPGEREILRYELNGEAHFVVGDGAGRVAFDPYGESRTVAEGRLVSRRIFRPAKE